MFWKKKVDNLPGFRNPPPPPPSKLTVSDEMKNNILELNRNRNDFNLKLIISLIRGSHLMGMDVINLDQVRLFSGYYSIDDTIVYYNNDIRDLLLKEGIASYVNSSRELVVTTADYRVEEMKNDVNE